MGTPIILAISILILVALGIVLIISLKKKKTARIAESLNMTLFLVMMPKYDLGKDRNNQDEEKKLISQMEQIFTNFLNLKNVDNSRILFKTPPRITFEIASQLGGSDILFYVAVPKYLESAFEKYIHGIYPKAEIEKTSYDYTIFEPGGKTSASYLKLKNASFFPINTYKNLEKDPLSTITNTLSKINSDEGAAIQVIIKPLAQRRWKNAGDQVLSKIREGKSVKTAVSEASRSSMIDLFATMVDIFSGKKTKEKTQEELKENVDERTIQAIQEKIQKQVFETNIRLITSAQTKRRSDEILSHLEGAFGQFSLGSLNNFEPIRIGKRGIHKFVYNFSFRDFNSKESNILNIEELASVYHFPTSYTKTPYIKTADSGSSAPPAELSEEGLVTLGKVVFRGEEKNVKFATREDRRRHFYVIGQTGTGKTSILREMIRQDIQNGEGVGVIDPHGDLIEDTLANIPKERIEDVVLFEPFDLDRPTGLNMMEYETPEQKDFAVQEMIAIFHTLFPPEIIGPMFEHYMRNAMLALMADQENPGTLVEIPRMFTDDEFMESKLNKVKDPLVRNFWLKEWKQTTGSTKSDMLGYVVSKVGRFIENEMMRNIIGQPHSGFNLGKIMNGKKIFLANLSKGMTGEVNSSLLGLILVSKMQMGAMRRASISEQERKDFYLYIDEFQNFTTDSIVTILSEARKYKLNLILAHQYMPQLTQEIRDAVLGNVGTMAAFRVGANDAEFLEKQFEPEFNHLDLANISNFNLIIKMLIDNKTSNPFKMQTIPPQEGMSKIVAPIKKVSKLKYSRPKEIVGAEILQRSKL